MNLTDPQNQAVVAARVRALPDATLCHMFALAHLGSTGSAAPAAPKAPRAPKAPAAPSVDGSAAPRVAKEVAPIDRNSPEGTAMVAYVTAAGEGGTSRPTIVAAFSQAPVGWNEKHTKDVIAGLVQSGALKIVGDKRGAKVMLA